MSAAGLAAGADQRVFVTELMQQVVRDVVTLSQRPDLASLAQRSDVATEVGGAAKGAQMLGWQGCVGGVGWGGWGGEGGGTGVGLAGCGECVGRAEMLG